MALPTRPSRLPSYHRYAGKALPGQAGDACHLLAWHSLDVAAVGWHLLAPERPLTKQLAARLDIEPEPLRRLLVFLLGLHDIGKFSRAFQEVLKLALDGMAPPQGKPYLQRHDRLGVLLWDACWKEWRKAGVLHWPDGEARARKLQTSMNHLVAPFFGHHGFPVATRQLTLADFFVDDGELDDTTAARDFVADWAALIAPHWPVDKLLDDEWLAHFKTLSWTIAGWATLSDWLGSHRDYFPYCQKAMRLSDYWPKALEQAEAVLNATGFARPPEPIPYTGLAHWFSADVTPTPLQQKAETLPLQAEPQLFILEDVTGAGKTEAACILAQRLLADGHGEGLYFALPTMATSNAMYTRLGDLHHRFYSAVSRPSLVLAHGARELNEAFERAIVQPDHDDYATMDASASTQCNRWLADSNKKALLADVGVGTIDQALMGGLPFRHQSLRLLGLSRKVLIVDEVHAFDHYMQTLLHQLLAHHARQGGSAILLTATLPRAMREALTAAWQHGLGAAPWPMEKTAYPLLTHCGAETIEEIPVATRPEVARRVTIDWLESEEEGIERVLAAVDAGECIVWVRNTVDDAIRAFQALRERHPDPERCLLFHARFAMVDRQRIESEVIRRFGKTSDNQLRRGQVIVTTQVFQESLDCDADQMVSDIAPIDLLIQRAGRLQRHQRGARPAPVLQVLAPAWSDTPRADWLSQAHRGTQAVYKDTSLVWLTMRVLRQQGAITMPTDARTLIEGVYAASPDDLPEAFDQAHFEHTGMAKHAVSMATHNALNLEEGYRLDDDFDPWQEERETGTRLSDEQSIEVVLLKRRGEELGLWVDDHRHADRLSRCRLRESQARKLARLPEIYAEQWEALQQRHRGLRFVQPWLPEEEGQCGYDAQWGVSFEQE
ncbi:MULTISPECIES: CRISPR-associated helicase Cas3' [unclassified Halomonas]|uniref:CRISPR-associated helicase Cas3' n=1 Tax=unclassified Halomonas TaxID=2609666 RepID=UPI00209EBBEB|nr:MULTISPECIES: CRISPR-associated helicase Cas3' [unclassified Halomonas]MCP1312791.1 CRISPR-associated helicase Cas3' [Halomonas sp. 707D7]MCP1325290.1 CRISPR-associated helicase Cas3' [Halomonas sp. 707D4]